jgi:hypothetical protein
LNEVSWQKAGCLNPSLTRNSTQIFCKLNVAYSKFDQMAAEILTAKERLTMKFNDSTTTSRKAAKVGGWTFFVVAMLSAIGMWLVVMAFFLMRHYVIGEPASWRGEWFFPSLFDLAMVGLLVLASGTITFRGVSWPVGHVAGRMIALQRRHYGWVGPFAMTVPMAIAAVVTKLMANILTNYGWLGEGDRYWQNFVLSVSLFMLWFLIPAMLTGLLGGLYLRQWGRKMADLTDSPKL